MIHAKIGNDVVSEVVVNLRLSRTVLEYGSSVYPSYILKVVGDGNDLGLHKEHIVIFN